MGRHARYLVSLIALVGCAQATLAAQLPKLEAVVLAPARGAEHFTRDKLSPAYKYRPKSASPTPTPELSQEQALRAAEAFVRKHFEVPPDIRLVPSIPRPSGIGGPQPMTVRVGCEYKGQRLDDCWSNVYFKGRDVQMAQVQLVRIKELPGTRHDVLTREAAVKKWMGVIEKMNPASPKPTKEELARFSDELTLQYVWSPENGGLEDESRRILIPAWGNAEGGRYLMNAFTGEVWEDD